MSPTPRSNRRRHARPGKVRTWWHPLLVGVLRWLLEGDYRVDDEVNVGVKPLQIDAFLVRLEGGELDPKARRLLAGLGERLNQYTLVEFKSPSDTLRAGDFQTLIAYALLWLALNNPLLPSDCLTLIVLAPRLTGPYREELTARGVKAVEEQPGVWRLTGGLLQHECWVLETEVLADAGHPVLAMFSPRLLSESSALSRELSEQGDGDLFAYVAQQVRQFRARGEEFAMRYSTEELDRIYEEITSGLPPYLVERILNKLSPEERLRGLSPQEVVGGLSAKEKAEYLRLLQQPEKKRKK